MFVLLLLCSLFQVKESFAYNLQWVLYTRSNSATPQFLNNYNEIDLSKETKVIIHGWLQTYTQTVYMQMKDAYLAKSDCNVILLDWSAYTLEYLSAVYNTKQIGESCRCLVGAFIGENSEKQDEMIWKKETKLFGKIRRKYLQEKSSETLL